MMDPLEKAFKEAFQKLGTVKRQRKDRQEALEFDGEVAKYAQSNEEASELKIFTILRRQKINATLIPLSFTILSMTI